MPAAAILALVAQLVQLGIQEGPIVAALLQSHNNMKDAGREEPTDDDLNPLRKLREENQKRINAAAAGDTVQAAD
jgi:hypothetical protein